MSLKKFHIVFIAMSLALSVFVFIWCKKNGSFHGVALSAQALLIFGLGYLVWFIRKYKKLA